MTDDRHLTHDELVLHYYGDAGGDARRFDRHLGDCDACRASLERLTRALSLVEASPADEPDAAFEARLWARLAPALESRTPWWRQAASVPASRWAAVGVVAASVLVAFTGGWWLRDPGVPPAPAVSGGPSAPAGESAPSREAFRSRVLDAAASDHLERAAIALSEFVHAGGAADAERDRAADLVAVSRLLRQSAEQRGDVTLDGLLGDIEVVLMELANAPADTSGEAIAALKARVESRDLLFRLRVLGDELRHRQEAPAALAAKGKTS